MGWNQQNVFNVLIVSSTTSFGGFFLYAGSPALGNPPIAWETTAMTDPYGNPLPGGPAFGLDGLPFLAYAQLASGGSVQQIISSGSGNWTAPAGVTTVRAECWGPGGNGGNGATFGGGGGGGGEYAAEYSLAVTPGNNYAYSVGAGGSGAATTFAGNTATVTAHAGPSASGPFGGQGATGSANTVHFNGGNGAETGQADGGGGGSSAGTLAAGNTGTVPAGASAPSGGGGGGNGGTTGNAGVNGNVPGGGAGGGGKTGGTGATGGHGQIRLTYSSSGSGQGLLYSLAGIAGTDNLGDFYPPGMTLGAEQAWVLPSGDTSGATDAANINGAYAAGYHVVQLLAGTYYIDAPIALGDQNCLLGQGPAPDDSYLNAATTIEVTSGFTGTAAITMTGSATIVGGMVLRDFYCDLTSAPASTAALIATQNVYGVVIEDVSFHAATTTSAAVQLNEASGNQPDGWRVRGLMIANCAGPGLFMQGADMIMQDVHVIGCAGDGCQIQTAANSQFLSWRMANNSGNGYNLGNSGAGTAGPDAILQLTGCNSQDNTGDGLHIQWSTSGGPLTNVTGFTSVNDGQNGTGSAVSITGGATSGFTGITGLDIAANGTGPANGILVNGASTNTTLVSARLWAVTTPLNNTAANLFGYRAIATKTGAGAWAFVADSA